MTENNKKELQTREAKGIVLEALSKIPEEEREELFKKYRSKDPIPMDKYHHAIAVGAWTNRAVKAIMHGATTDELKKILRVIWVAIESSRKNLDLERAIKEENMDEIMVKYIRPALIEQRKTKNRKEQLRRAATMKTVLKMHEKNFSNERIAEILNIPESTVHFFLQNKSINAAK